MSEREAGQLACERFCADSGSVGEWPRVPQKVKDGWAAVEAAIRADAFRAGQEDMKRRAVEVAYSRPLYVISLTETDETGKLFPGSPYDRGRYEAAQAIASLEVRDE